VDDDPDDQVLFVDALERIDPSITCLKANGGEEALSMLKGLTVSPDIIFVDFNMPKMNGQKCIVELKKSSALRDIPLVIYSTTLTPSDIDNLKRLGANEVMVKPPAFEKYVWTLKAILFKCLPSSGRP
jgi:CheY-like chemotaxis protein